MQSPSFYSGTSNIALPIKQSEYPPEFKGTSRLSYYASLFSSLEVNSTFYKLPRPATVEKWRDGVPPHFRFTFKIPKTVTHAKGLQFSAEELEVFAETISLVGHKRGCLLLQLPPSVKRERQEELEGILESLGYDAKDWKIAVEVYRILQGYGATMVEQDLPKCPCATYNGRRKFCLPAFSWPGSSVQRKLW